MRTVRWLVAFGAVAAWAISSPARALIIRTIDPDNYLAGTNLTEVVSDVRISRLSQSGLSTYDPTRRDVFANGSTFGGISNYFEYQECYERNSLWGCGSGFSVIEFAFSSPTDFVQLDFAWLSDGPGILIYGEDDNLLASCYSAFGGPVTGPCDYWTSGYSSSAAYNDYTISLQLDSRHIGRIVAGTPAGAWAYVNSISYGVPEPGTLALLGLGLVGLGFSRRRKLN